MLKSKTNIVILGLGVVILVLLAVVIFRSPDTVTVVEPFDDSHLKEEIQELTSDNTRLEAKNAQLVQERDSITEIKNEVKIIYREKLKYIGTAGLTELDSIIRSSID